MKLLLDTCTFLWVVAGSRELSERAAREFQDPANEVYLSAVSAWEIAVKHMLGKLPLPEDPRRFVPSQRALHRIEALPLGEQAVLTLGRLPALHKDPFDRMLICQAIEHGMTLLTPDPLLTQYPVASIW
jgi:PIN domain nuclease of toxin-antitoxin system